MTSTPRPVGRRRGALAALALAGVAGLTAAPALASGPAAGTRVVVTGPGAAAAVVRAGGAVLVDLPLVHGVAATLPAGVVLPAGLLVTPDRAMSTAAAPGTTTAGPASSVRATLGLGAPAGEGAGATVAVVDTGVADVAALGGRVTHVDVTGSGPGDGLGHGTFIAGLVAGPDGVAPGASVLDVKVADAQGTTGLVQVLKGLQAVAAHKDVDVVNLSLASGSPLPYQLDPLTLALDALWRRGIVVVVPAGNDGPAAGTVVSPGVDPTLITVGALDDAGTASRSDDTVAPWSARARAGQSKPDLVAPGSHLLSTLAPGSAAAAAQTRTDLPAGYGLGSGTSFSTAVASGAAADLVARDGKLRPDQVKALLVGTAYRGPGLQDPTAAGAGGLDLAAALAAPRPTGKPAAEADAAPDAAPGRPAAWARLVDALGGDDPAAVTDAWSALPASARNWAAHNWAGLDPEARDFAAATWGAHNWAGDATQGALMEWAAHNWAAHNWADGTWDAHNWAAQNWAAADWTAHNWAAHNWAAHNWAAADWTAHNWAAHNWAAHNWAGSTWDAHNWADMDWAAHNWAAHNWAADSWATATWGR